MDTLSHHKIVYHTRYSASTAECRMQNVETEWDEQNGDGPQHIIENK